MAPVLPTPWEPLALFKIFHNPNKTTYLYLVTTTTQPISTFSDTFSHHP